MQISAELSALLPGGFANKARFLVRNIRSCSPEMIVSCLAQGENNVLELRGDWGTLKRAHDLLEEWMNKQGCACGTQTVIPVFGELQNGDAVANSPTSALPLNKSSPVNTMAEHTSDDLPVDNDIPHADTVVPDNDIKDERHVSPKKSYLGETPRHSSATVTNPDKNKLCKKRGLSRPSKYCHKLGMNLRRRTIGAVAPVELQVKDECDLPGDVDKDSSDPDWQENESVINNSTDDDKEDKDKIKVKSSETTAKEHCGRENGIEQPGTDDDGFDASSVRCEFCTYKTTSKKNLKHHMRRKHLERTFKCAECGKAFGLGKDLNEHIRSHSKQVACEVCDKKFTRDYFLKKHFANKHVSKMAKPDKVKTPKEKPEKQLVYACKQCDYIGKTARNLRIHIRRTHGEKTLPCSMCNKTFAMTKDLKQHVRTHTERFSCEICGKALKSKFALQLHRNAIHLGIKNTYMKPYLCTICGKLCSNKTVYREHQNKEHLGIKPYSCDICNMAFFSKAGLRVHRRIHSEVRSHMCDVCGKAFKGRQSLRLHQNIHRQWRPHKCEECNKRFTQKGALVRHERIHTGERPFRCRLCSSSFNDYSILRRHLIGLHKQPDGKIQRRSTDAESDVKPYGLPMDIDDKSITVPSTMVSGATIELVTVEHLPSMCIPQELPDMAISAATLQCADDLRNMAGLTGQQVAHNLQLVVPSPQFGPPSQVPLSSQLGPPSQVPLSSQLGPPSQVPLSSQLGPPSQVPLSSQLGPPSQVPLSSQLGPPSQVPLSSQLSPLSSQFGVPSSQFDATSSQHVPPSSHLVSPSPPFVLPSSHGEHIHRAVAHQHSCGDDNPSHSLPGDQLITVNTPCYHQPAVDGMRVVNVSIQDRGHVVTSATMRPQDLPLQEAAHTLLHDMGRVSLAHLPHTSPHFAPLGHEMGLPVGLLPMSGPPRHLHVAVSHEHSINNYAGANADVVGTQLMCSTSNMTRDAAVTDIHLL